jgi:hypothetical protein
MTNHEPRRPKSRSAINFLNNRGPDEAACRDYLSGCGGRKDFAARYALGRITGLRSGACVTAGGAVGRPR